MLGRTNAKTGKRYGAYINVTVSSVYGASTVSVLHSDSGETYEQSNVPNGGTVSFLVTHPGEWSITAANGVGQYITETRNLPKGKDISVSVGLTVPYTAYINVTVRSIYGNSTIAISNTSGDSDSQNNITSGSTVTFTVHRPGSWSISATSGQSKSGSVTLPADNGASQPITLVVPYYFYSNRPLTTFTFNDTDGQGSSHKENDSGSYWVYCSDGGMTRVWSPSVDLTGYGTLHVSYRLRQRNSGSAYYTAIGLSTQTYPSSGYFDIAGWRTIHWNSSVYADDNKWVARTTTFAHNGQGMFWLRITGYGAEIWFNNIWVE